MFGDLVWPLNVSRGLSAIAELLAQFFHSQTQHQICNETGIKDPTTPQTRRYTTSWTVNVRQLYRQSETNVSFNNKFNLLYYS